MLGSAVQSTSDAKKIGVLLVAPAQRRKLPAGGIASTSVSTDTFCVLRRLSASGVTSTESVLTRDFTPLIGRPVAAGSRFLVWSYASSVTEATRGDFCRLSKPCGVV